jgi:glutathione synthase/RimK-type ligase-like ATP-grasp enzyme
MKVALATCKQLPEPDVDEALLVGALTQRGVEARLVAWDDPDARLEDGELVVVRSTWNYHKDVEGFLAWVERTARTARLFNPVAVIRGNVRKTYLRELASSGIPIIPTRFVERREPCSLKEVFAKHGWSKVVIKPTVSAGSFRTQSFEDRDHAEGQCFLDELTAEREVMIQQWMPSVEGYGERSLVWIDGALTHAIRKSPRFQHASESVSSAVPIADDERALADRVLALLPSDLLYARVDVVRDEENGNVLRLMELELIEPSLFLKQCPAAVERLVDGIVRHANELA